MIAIGVRREDKNRWEARVPLTPDHVAELVEKHELDIVVQPSELRAFSDKDYRAAGAGNVDAVLVDRGGPARQRIGKGIPCRSPGLAMTWREAT